MIREFIKTLLADYERLLITKVLMMICLVGGFMMTVLILAILLLLMYPPYMWCVFGGFVILWAICLLVLYGYCRIIKAEHQARTTQFDSIDRYIQVATTMIVGVFEQLRKPSKKKR